MTINLQHLCRRACFIGLICSIYINMYTIAYFVFTDV